MKAEKVGERGMQEAVIVGIGVVTLDLLQQVRCYLPEGTTQPVEEERFVIGGPVGRGILTCHRLGQPCRIVGMIGRGRYAEELRALLAKEGIAHDLQEAKDAGTSQHSTIILSRKTGSRTILWQHQPPADAAGLAAVKKALAQASVCLLDCTDYPLTLAVAAECRARGVPVVLDTNTYKPGVEDLLPSVDHLLVPAFFLEKAPWIHRGMALPEALAALAGRTAAACVAVTDGPRGGFYWLRETGKVEGFAAVPVTVTVDSCGAGDTFHGAYACGIARRWPVAKAIAFAAWAAAHKCAALGNDGLPDAGAGLIWEGAYDGRNAP